MWLVYWIWRGGCCRWEGTGVPGRRGWGKTGQPGGKQWKHLGCSDKALTCALFREVPKGPFREDNIWCIIEISLWWNVKNCSEGESVIVREWWLQLPRSERTRSLVPHWTLSFTWSYLAFHWIIWGHEGRVIRFLIRFINKFDDRKNKGRGERQR